MDRGRGRSHAHGTARAAGEDRSPMEPPSFPPSGLATVRAAPGSLASLALPPPAGTPPFTYAWSRAGASLDDRFTVTDDSSGVRLTVSAAQTGDSGVYTLQASNAAGSDTSRVRLEVSADEAPTGDDPPTFLRRLQDLTVKVGTRTRFLVEILSSTECKVTWYRNERRLLEAERVSLARDGNFWCADVAAVSVDDAGRWTCTAENVGGRASCSAHLNVLVPKAYKRPEFVEELRALLTEQGTVSLECKVVGVPTPVLRWFKDSCEIKAGDVFALTANAEDPTSLGTYTCEAVNCMGRAYSSSKVHVVGRGSREGSARPSSSGLTPEPPPIFTRELEDQFAKICEHLTLSCHLVVPPWPRSVVWYNKEGKVEPSERYHVLEDGAGGYLLEIPSAEWPDEGEWKCVATSNAGRVGISTCYVTMDVPKNYRKPRFMENLQAVLTEEGLVSFECKVVGFPTPVLSWFKDGQELKPGDVYQLTGTNSLGSYCCIARNCMGQASSSAELTVEDIQNQLNEEEKLQLFSKNQAPKFVQGLKSIEAKIDEPFRFTIKVAIPPEPSVMWYRDDQPVDESNRCHLGKEERGVFYLDIQSLEFLDQAEWKCVAMNDFGHSVTSCFLKLLIPRHYKKPRFLENLQAILSEEGAVNLECKVIGVPQPVLKWYKDGEELKPGDIHRIISGQDGTCCLGTYTCEAQNCMGIAASSASLLGFDDSMKAKKKKAEEQALQRNLSLSTIHEERTSQMYDTPVGDITTMDDKGEISFSFDGKEVSVSLYETPDLTEEEALQIVEMYADQLSENITEHNVVELPPLRFVKETSTSGNLLMEAVIIDVSPDYFVSPEEDLRTEADVEDISIADENGPPQLSLDQDIDIGGENYLEKTMALLSEEKSDIPFKLNRKKSDSQKSADDYFSLSREQSISEDKKDDDTQVLSESDMQSFASAHSSDKPKSKSLKAVGEDGVESSEPTKTVIVKDGAQKHQHDMESPVVKPKRERRSSRSSRRSSSGSEKSLNKDKEDSILSKEDSKIQIDTAKNEETPIQLESIKPKLSTEEFKNKMATISNSLSKVINDVQIIEREIILKSELMSSAATASRSLEIISSLISPLSEIHSMADAARDSALESSQVSSSIFNTLPRPLKSLQQAMNLIEKCIDMESDSKTLVKKTCVAFIETCGSEVQRVLSEITSIVSKDYFHTDYTAISEISSITDDMTTVVKFAMDTIITRNLLNEASEIKVDELSLDAKHLRDTQKAVFELKGPLSALLYIAESAESGKLVDITKVKNSDVVLNDMSQSIQDLQTGLEQIETLSVKENNSSLHKYNTQIIETVMDSIVKLRSSFEQISIMAKNEDKSLMKLAVATIKENLTEISSKLDTIEINIGKFDVLQSENKLDALQKMAQILIALENNLPRLEAMPKIKANLTIFHKNLTRVLENVIESNEANKYFTFMEICDAVKRINGSIKNIDVEDGLPLASLSNTLRLIQDNFIQNVFESELNCSILSNISDTHIEIQEAINTAEEKSISMDYEEIHDFSNKNYDKMQAKIVVDHINLAIAAIENLRAADTPKEFISNIAPSLQSICPILVEIKQGVASLEMSHLEDEHLSDLSELSYAQTLATPVCDLNQNIIILNQQIIDNIESMKESGEILATLAEPLNEIQNSLVILQQEVVSQYGEASKVTEMSINLANAVQNLHSCIVMIQEHAGVEFADEISTLEDVSGIKTTADIISSDRLILPTTEETAIQQIVSPYEQEFQHAATAQALQTLNDNIIMLQQPDIIDALETLSEVSDYSSLKSIAVELGELHTGIEEILHPIVIERSNELVTLINPTKLIAIAEPLHELQQGLSVLDSSNIPIYENILELPADKIHSLIQSVSEFKEHLNKCMMAVFPVMETADSTIKIANKVGALREVCEHLKDIIEMTKATQDFHIPDKAKALELTVESLLDATDISKTIKIEQVKSITEQLYEDVTIAQEEIIQFITQSPAVLSQEAELIETIQNVENNIAVLEEYEFVDLSHVSDATCISPCNAAEIDSKSLNEIKDIVQNAIIVVKDSAKDVPFVDLMIVEDFFNTCKSEFTVLRCLITKPNSHKKIIRLIQEFNSLRNTLNSFKKRQVELNLPDDVKGCIENFYIYADECIKTVQTVLICIVESQSEILVKLPVDNIANSTEVIQKMIENNNYKSLNKCLNECAQIIELMLPHLRHIQFDVIHELNNPDLSQTKTEGSFLLDKMEELLACIDKSKTLTTDVKSQKLLEKISKSIDKHLEYKDAVGTGKNLIILKCLSDCIDVIQETALEIKVPTQKLEESNLNVVLSEMLEPLRAVHSQITNIQKQIASGVNEDFILTDVSCTESLIQTITEKHKEIVQQIETEQAVGSQDISLIIALDTEIHSMQDELKSLGTVEAAENIVKEIIKPIEDIEKSLLPILSSKIVDATSTGELLKDINSNIDTLQNAIERFVNIDVDLLIASCSFGEVDLHQSLQIATEIKRLLTLNNEELESPEVIEIKHEKVRSLYKILSAIDWTNDKIVLEGKSQLENEKFKNISLTTYQLLAELNKVIKSVDEEKIMNEGNPREIIEHIDQYIELIEIVEEVSAIIKLENIRETVDIARELRESIAAIELINQPEMGHERYSEICLEQAQLAQKLQRALSELHVQVVDCAQELAPELSTEVLQRIARVTAQLKADLIAVTGVHIAIQAPSELSLETTYSKDFLENNITDDYNLQALEEEALAKNVAESVEVSTLQSAEFIPEKGKQDQYQAHEVLDENLAVIKEDTVVVDSMITQIVESVCEDKAQEICHGENNAIESSDKVVLENVENEVHEVFDENIDIAKDDTVVIDNMVSQIVQSVCEDKVREIIHGENNAMESSDNVIVENVENKSTEEVDKNKSYLEKQQTLQIAVIEENKASSSISIDKEKEQETEQVKEANIKITIDELKQHMEKYTSHEIVEAVNELSTALDIEELKLSVDKAIELRESISISEINEVESSDRLTGDLVAQQADLAHHLQAALTALENVVLDSALELSKTEALSQVTEAAEILRANLVATIIQQTIEEPTQFKSYMEVSEDKTASSALIVTESNAEPPSDLTIQNSASIPLIEDNAVAQLSQTNITIDLDLPVREVAGESEEKNLKKLSEPGTLLKHIEDFISPETTEIIEEISTLTHFAELKDSLILAKDLKESILIQETILIEEISPVISETKTKQGKLMQELKNALSTLHIKTLDNAEEILPAIQFEALQRVSEIITHLQEHLENVSTTSLQFTDRIPESDEEDSMQTLRELLQDVTEIINKPTANKNSDDTERLKDTLDEVQTVIIKLKRDYDGANDTLNETLEDLECSVRSVQLQIHEESPPELLQDACASLQLLVNNMTELQEVNIKKPVDPINKSENVIEKCTSETDETVRLLELASNVSIQEGNLIDVVKSLDSLIEAIKLIKLSFLDNAEILIEKGIDITQNLINLEDKVFSLEKDLSEASLGVQERDSILTAIHSVYGSISNMRSAICSIQKRYMFENYGKPSEILLHAIKNAASISNIDLEHKKNWKTFSKSLRKVLSHFEDIKFYINLDKTARLPSDAAFTKIILNELKSNIVEIIVPKVHQIGIDMKGVIQDSVDVVEQILAHIEMKTAMDVKEKIPIFKKIATKMLELTHFMKTEMTEICVKNDILQENYNMGPTGTDITENNASVKINNVESEAIEIIKPGEVVSNKSKLKFIKHSSDLENPPYALVNIENILNDEEEINKSEIYEMASFTLKEIIAEAEARIENMTHATVDCDSDYSLAQEKELLTEHKFDAPSTSNEVIISKFPEIKEISDDDILTPETENKDFMSQEQQTKSEKVEQEKKSHKTEAQGATDNNKKENKEAHVNKTKATQEAKDKKVTVEQERMPEKTKQEQEALVIKQNEERENRIKQGNSDQEAESETKAENEKEQHLPMPKDEIQQQEIKLKDTDQEEALAELEPERQETIADTEKIKPNMGKEEQAALCKPKTEKECQKEQENEEKEAKNQIKPIVPVNKNTKEDHEVGGKNENEALAQSKGEALEANTAKEQYEQEAEVKIEEEKQEAKVQSKKHLQETKAAKEEQELMSTKENEEQEAKAKKEKDGQEASITMEKLDAKDAEEQAEVENMPGKVIEEKVAKGTKEKEEQEAKAKTEMEEQEAQAKKEKIAQKAKTKEDKEKQEAKAKKEKEEQDAITKMEEEAQEAKALKEKEDQEAKEQIEKEEQEAKAKKDEEEQEAKLLNEKEEQEVKKEKGEQDAKAKMEVEAQEAKALKEKEDQEAKALKKKEEQEAKAKKEKEEQDAIAKMEEEAQEAKALKEKEDHEAKAQKETEEQEAKAVKEREKQETKARKEKEEQEAKTTKEKEEQDAKVKIEEDAQEALKGNEDQEAKALKEKEEQEAKAKKEREEQEAKARKEMEEQEAKAKNEREEEEAKALKEKEEQEVKAMKEKEEQEAKTKKEREEQEAKIRKESEELDARAKIEEKAQKAKALKEKEDHEQEAKATKEKEEQEAKTKKETEEQEAKARKESEEQDAKPKIDEKAQEAKALKETEDLDQEAKEHEAVATKEKEEQEAKAVKERKKQETEAKKEKEEQEAKATKEKEEQDAKAKIEEDAQEAKALKEKEDQEAKALKEKEEQEAKAKKEREQQEAKARNEREEQEAKAKKEREEEEARAIKEKEEQEVKAMKEKEEQEAKTKKEMEEQEAEARKESEELDAKAKIEEKAQEAKTLKEKEDHEQEAKATKETEDQEAKTKKEREEQEAKARKESEEQDPKAKIEEKAQEGKALEGKEDHEQETKATKEKEQQEAKVLEEKEEQKAKAKKEKEKQDAKTKMEQAAQVAKTLKHKEDQEAKAQKEKEEQEAKAAKEREEQETKAKKEKEEQGAKATKEKEEQDAKTKMEEVGQEAKALKEKEDQEAKAQKEKKEQEGKAKKEGEEQEAKARKKREDKEAKAKKEREEQEAKARKEKEEQVAKAMEEKVEQDVKAKIEEKAQEAKSLKEKEDHELEAKEQEAKATKVKEEQEAKAQNEREEQEAKATKEREEQEAKAAKEKEQQEGKVLEVKEEQVAKAMEEKEEQDVKAKIEEKAQEAKSLNEKEDHEQEAKATKEKEEQEAKAKNEKEEQEAKARKEREEQESKAKKEREEREAKATNKKKKQEAKELKEKEDQEAKARKEKEEQASKAAKEREEQETKAKIEKEEQGAKASKEKEEQDAKTKMEEEAQEAKALKEKEDKEAKAQKEKKEQEVKAKKKGEEQEAKAKKDKEKQYAKAKMEEAAQAANILKEKEDQDALKKKKEQEAKAAKEREKQEDKAKKQNEEKEAKTKKEKEDQETMAQKEKEEQEAKANNEKKEQVAKAMKEKEEQEAKAKNERDEQEAKARKEREEQEYKANKEREEREAKATKEKEKHEAKVLKEKEDQEIKARKEKEEQEAKAAKEREEQETKAKKEEEEQEAKATKEKEEQDAKTKMEDEEQEAKAKKEKEKQYAKAKMEEAAQAAKILKEKEDQEAQKEKEEQDAKAAKERQKQDKAKKQNEEQEAKTKKEKEDQEAMAQKKMEEQEATANKERKEQKAKAKMEVEAQEAKAAKEKKDQDAKTNIEKEEQEAMGKKEKEEQTAKAKMEEEAQEANAYKENKEQEAKPKNEREEEEAKARKEREEQETKAKKEREEQEAKATKEKEEQDAKAKMEEAAQAAETSKEKEDQEAKATKKKEELDAKAKIEEVAQAAKTLKEKEDSEAKAQKEKERQEAKASKKREKQEAKAKKENDEQQVRAQKEKEEQEAKAKKEKEEQEAKDTKEREEQETKAKKEREEQDARAEKEKEEHETKAKKEKEEQEAKAQKEKEDQEAKVKKIKENEEAQRLNKKKNQTAKAAKEREEKEAKAKKEKEESEAKAETEREEQETKAKKEREDQEAKAKKDKDEQETKAKKEKEEQEAKAQKEKEEQRAKAKKEKEEQETKANKEKEEQEAQTQNKKKKQHAKAVKEKEEKVANAKNEKEEQEVKAKKEKEQQEAKVKKELEKQEAGDEKQKEQQEIKAKKEKEDQEPKATKQKEEQETKAEKENEKQESKAKESKKVKTVKETKKHDAKAAKETEKKEVMAKTEKEEVEAMAEKESEEHETKAKKEKVEQDAKAKKQKEQQETKTKKEREDQEAMATKAKEEQESKSKEEKKAITVNEPKRHDAKAVKEKEEQEAKVHKKKGEQEAKARKENNEKDYQETEINNDISSHKMEVTVLEDRYIKEYQYEPRKQENERNRFIDHNHKDYTSEFLRPTNYRERTCHRDKPPEDISLGKNATVYKAQSIILDAHLRSSVPPLDKNDPERRERLRSKALSETRSIFSERRPGLSRDSKRKPVFSTYLTDRTAVEGSRVKLTCSVLSSSEPQTTWYKNGVILDNKLKYRTKMIDGLITLEVLNAVPSDSAEYSCTVNNDNGTVSTSSNLKVYPSFEASPIPPTFTRSIRDTYHLAENELVLECRIRGQPLPTITWLKDDKPVTNNDRYQAYYLADGVCRLAISSPTSEDSGKYTCKAENSMWTDQITHVVSFTGRERRLSPNLATIERSRFNRHAMESRRPHFTNVLTDYQVAHGGTIGLQVEIRGSPTRVEWLREGRAVTEVYRNARTFVEQGLYTLALSDVTEKESGMYTCRAWSSHGNVDMNAAITVVQPNEMEGKPAIIVGRPEKDILISVGEDINISFRVQGEPKPKVVFMKGIRDITNNQRACKMTSDDYVKFTLKRSVVSDAGTYCILARNAYGCDRAFVTVVVRQRASSENLISDWTYPMDDSALTIAERKYKSVPERIPGEPTVVDGGNNWVSLAWPKPDQQSAAPVLAYKVEGWLLGKEGGARWVELGITPLNSFDAFNLKQGEEYHFRVTPRNRYGWGESVQTSTPVGIGLAGDRPEFIDILPGQLKVLAGETANLSCSIKGKPLPEVVWMKNGHEVEEQARMTTLFNGHDCCLIIKDINSEDEGRYSCEASNVHGRASTYARLAVVTDRLIWEADAKLKRERSADALGEFPPQFTMRLRDRRVQATFPVRLTCQVVGCPQPALTWYKDGQEVTLDSRRNKYQDEHFHTLEIAPTTLEDGGVYEAMARNSCGAVSCRCGLVVDKGIRAYVAPEFCCGLEPLYRLAEGDELRISAVVEAYPSVGVTWYRDGVRLRPSRRAVMTLDRDGQIELALASVTPRDAGVYTCTASNEVGRASTSGKVEVVGGELSENRTPPVVINTPDTPYSREPMFTRKPRSSEAREGDTVIIECEVVGDPKPDVYWLRDFLKPDYYRDASHFKRVGEGPEYRFEIPHAKLDYTGAYSVVARNAHGEAKAIISLQILAKDPSSCDDAHNVRYGRVEVIPRFERNLTDLLSYDGDAVEFECHVTGNPEPDIRWFHYHEVIRDCPDFESSFEEGTARLKIKQVAAEDEGTYTCEASNTLGKATSSACLVVYPPGEPNTLSQRLRRPPALLSGASTPRSTPRSTPARSVSRTPGPDTRRLCSPSRQMAPSFYTYPFNKVVEEGDSVTFQCAVKGLPAPWASWDKDGIIITPSARITIREKDELMRILEIEQVTIEDVGIYRITLENEYGRAEASARLEVITQKGKFYGGLRAGSASPRRCLSYRRRTPSSSRQD